MPMMIKQYLPYLLIWALAIIPIASLGQADTLFIQFHPKSESTFQFETGNGNYMEELTYTKRKRWENEVIFRIKTMMFVHNTRTMKKEIIPKKDATFIHDPVSPTEVENYIISMLKKYPFGGLPSQPGVKRLFMVEDEGGDFFTLYEVKWELNL